MICRSRSMWILWRLQWWQRYMLGCRRISTMVSKTTGCPGTKMDHHEMGLPSLEVEMGLYLLEVVGMVEEVVGEYLERSFANAAYAPHLTPAGNGIQVFEEAP
ncbi:hypothetical protein BU17DRAFT_63688 [Hysterangium stoloniferum]|nr:hypothetical protein BU17DRAFT_63688 [Hysterangium stoloniferum]